MNYENTQPNEDARILVAQLFDRLALAPDGQPFDDDDPASWAVADATEPEIAHLGAARFTIIDPDAASLAVAAGAIYPGATATLAMRVQFELDSSSPVPAMGQYIVLPTDEPAVSLLFRVWLTHADLHDIAAPDLGPDAVRNEALDALQPGEALLVQVFGQDDDGVAA